MSRLLLTVMSLKLPIQSVNKDKSFHRKKLTEIILLTMLGVLMYVSQVIMAPLPNIELVSLFIILITRRFGYKAFLSVYVFVGCEILTYGLSMWVINYLYVWDILVIVILIIKSIDNTVIYTLISCIFGLLFGTFCSIPYFLIGGVAAGIGNIISGISYDSLHCVGNFILTLLLYRPLTKVMNKII